MAGIFDQFSNAANALGTGGLARNAAYSKVSDMLAQAYLRQQEAMKNQQAIETNRSQNDAIASLQSPEMQAIVDKLAGMPGMGKYLGAIQAGGRGNAEQLAQALNLIEQSGMRRTGVDDLTAGNAATGNANLAGVEGKPMELARVENNTVVRPFAGADQQSFAPTSVGNADIQRMLGQASEAIAKAAKARTEADNVGGGKPDKAQALPPDMLKGYFSKPFVDPTTGQPASDPLTGTPISVPDTAKMQDFFMYAAKTGQKNQVAALPNYVNDVASGKWQSTVPPAPAQPAMPAPPQASPGLGERLGNLLQGAFGGGAPANAGPSPQQKVAAAGGNIPVPKIPANVPRMPTGPQQTMNGAGYDPLGILPKRVPPAPGQVPGAQ